MDSLQLQLLLADRLVPKGLSGQRPSAAVTAVMEGTGPQQIRDTTVGLWNMYNWTALKSGKLPDAAIVTKKHFFDSKCF